MFLRRRVESNNRRVTDSTDDAGIAGDDAVVTGDDAGVTGDDASSSAQEVGDDDSSSEEEQSTFKQYQSQITEKVNAEYMPEGMSITETQLTCIAGGFVLIMAIAIFRRRRL